MRRLVVILSAMMIGTIGPAGADLDSAERQLRAGLHEMAAREFLSEATKGSAQAMYRLGELCEQGIGVEQNLLDAKRWYGRAAERGHKPARERLKALGERR
ncbi:MAG: sel1 repeat family protein [Rhodospirillales bacterium]|nr:sel1 repeat family protein [Rhodospirillales bacterium]